MRKNIMLVLFAVVLIGGKSSARELTRHTAMVKNDIKLLKEGKKEDYKFDGRGVDDTIHVIVDVLKKRCPESDCYDGGPVDVTHSYIVVDSNVYHTEYDEVYRSGGYYITIENKQQTDCKFSLTVIETWWQYE